MGLTGILRYLVFALLLHLLALIVLGSIKIVAIIPKVIASFDSASLPPAKEEEPDAFAAFRDFDYNGPTLGGGGGTPGKGPGGIPTAAGTTPTEYKASVDTKDNADSQVSEVIGVVSESATAVARLQTTGGGLSAPTTGLGEGKIGTAGIRGPGGGGFGQRVGPMRAQNLHAHGGEGTEKAVLAGLRWLKNNQQPDGSWTSKTSVYAVSALGTLAFLGHGETPDSEEFGPTVSKALQYLVKSVGTDGLVPGGKPEKGYAEGIVTLALSEAYGMTQSPAVKEPLDRLVAAIVRWQTSPKKDPKQNGGWRYTPNSDESDVSVTGWMVMGLKSARLAGVEVPHEAFDKASQYLWNMYGKEGFGYDKPGDYPATTAIGVLCQQFIGHSDDRRIKKALDFLREQKVNYDTSDLNWSIYSWYYITQAMFQGGGSYWEYWNHQIRDTMVKAQLDDGRWPAPPKSKFESKEANNYSPAYFTSMGCLILEVYYRYLPIYQEMEKKPALPALPAAPAVP